MYSWLILDQGDRNAVSACVYMQVLFAVLSINTLASVVGQRQQCLQTSCKYGLNYYTQVDHTPQHIYHTASGACEVYFM